jgi:spore germination protein YaaH
MADPMIVKTLQQIAKRNGGYLRPRDVVDAARDEKSPLHNQFEWDDSIASEKYRQWQARALIRVQVEFESVGDGEEIAFRVFTSLVSDRLPAGGYRVTTNVMANPELRDELLADALAEMRRFQAKYRHLKELAEVFAAMEGVEAKVGKKG